MNQAVFQDENMDWQLRALRKRKEGGDDPH